MLNAVKFLSFTVFSCEIKIMKILSIIGDRREQGNCTRGMKNGEKD